MARRKKYKRPTREQVKAMTPEERLAHKRALEADRQYRQRVRRRATTTVAERRERAQQEIARLFNWERLLPHIRREPNGCWIWLGGFQTCRGVLRPWARGGALGGMRVDHIVCCLYRGRPPPKCLPASTCATIGCVAPEHLVWSNRAVETAKRRRNHEQAIVFR